MFCPKCGKENVDGSNFCFGCGADFTKLTPAPKKDIADTLDRSVTIGQVSAGPQYDTLDAAATQGQAATLLGDQYRVLKKLGEGGMGVVYLAEDMEMDNLKVAIKVLPPLLSKNTRAVENLRREAITAIKLNHPNIIRLYGFHTDGDIKYLVMEYVEGQDLEEHMASRPGGKLDLDELLPIIEQVAKALDHAHGEHPPVVHRDLKPSNIMISASGRVKLMDFGIAREIKDSYTRVTGRNDTSGTLPYMSPEQLRGKRPTPAMDIYALGAVCYECLRGSVPFASGDISYQIIHEKPELLEDVPDEVNEALQATLAKEADDRPAAAGQVMALLKGMGRAEGIIDSGKVAKVQSGRVIAGATVQRELPIAIGPFDGDQAREYQRLIAEFLGLPIDETIGFG